MNKFGFNSLRKSTIRIPDDFPFDVTDTQLRFREVGGTEWQTVEGVAMNVPETNRVVHTVEITGLQPESSYEFQPSSFEAATYLTWRGDPSRSMVVHWHTMKPFKRNLYTVGFNGQIKKFKTAPETITEKVRFAQVSDTHGGNDQSKLVFERIGAQENILAIIHSGDVATGNGGTLSPRTFYQFFDAYNHAVDSEGHLIPLLPNLGNHEILNGAAGMQYRDETYEPAGVKPNFETKERGDAEWYYSFFPSFPGLTGYGVLNFGDYASVWQLDPGLTTLTNAGQDTWLSNTMAARATVPNKFVSTHYSPYPAGRREITSYNRTVLRDFVPIIEPYKPVFFSGHEHVFSVSTPIYNGAVDEENGIYYLGSGNPVEDLRDARNPATKWWIDKGIGTTLQRFAYEMPGGSEERVAHPDDGKTYEWWEGSHFWLIECDYTEKTMTAFNGHNEVIHTFTIANT